MAARTGARRAATGAGTGASRPRAETLTTRVDVGGTRLRVRLAPEVVEALRRTAANPARSQGPAARFTRDWLDSYLERMQVVEDCAVCRRPLIAEEITAHALQHVPARVRPLATMALDLDDDDRRTLAAFLAAHTPDE